MSAMQLQRKRPNILITGTPGVGKSCTASAIAERIPHMKYINVGELVKQHKCHEGVDTEFDSFILDEEKLIQVMETIVEEAASETNEGLVVDFHSCDFFPQEWFDLVLVLRSETAVLYDRLTARGYSDKKRNENMECEIMQVVLEEARESYDQEIVHEVPSNTVEDIHSNVERVQLWVEQWIQDNTT